jgi:hypothetical protein
MFEINNQSMISKHDECICQHIRNDHAIGVGLPTGRCKRCDCMEFVIKR